MEKLDLKLGLNQIHTGVVFGFGRFWVPPTPHGPYRQFGSLQHALDLAAVSGETRTGGFGLKMDLAVQHVLLIHSRDVKDGGNGTKYMGMFKRAALTSFVGHIVHSYLPNILLHCKFQAGNITLKFCAVRSLTCSIVYVMNSGLLTAFVNNVIQHL